MRKVFALCLALLICFGMAACGKKDNHEISTVYEDKHVGFQLEMPAVGDQIAVMHTSKGDISIRFFPEAAPKAVENFVNHSQNGYYNGLTFHRVMQDFMIQGGDPKGDGTGGVSYWGGNFEDEFDPKLLNLRGSLAMANSGVNTNGSQFFINQGGKEAFAKSYTTLEEFIKACSDNETDIKKQYDNLIATYGESAVKKEYGSLEDVLATYVPNSADLAPSKDVWELYTKNGGNLHLDGAWRRSGGHTVFGQVFKGMDVVDAIAAVETDSNDKPLEAVTITSIEITTYQG